MFTAIHYGTSPSFKSYNLKPSTLLSHFSPGRRFCPSETGQCSSDNANKCCRFSSKFWLERKFRTYRIPKKNQSKYNHMKRKKILNNSPTTSLYSPSLQKAKYTSTGNWVADVLRRHVIAAVNSGKPRDPMRESLWTLWESRVDSNESLWTQNKTKTSQVRLRKTLRIPYTIFDTPLDFHLVSHRTGMLHRNTVAFAGSRYRYSVNHLRVWISTQHENSKNIWWWYDASLLC